MPPTEHLKNLPKVCDLFSSIYGSYLAPSFGACHKISCYANKFRNLLIDIFKSWCHLLFYHGKVFEYLIRPVSEFN